MNPCRTAPRPRFVLSLCFSSLCSLCLCGSIPAAAAPVRVGAKSDVEGSILGEMLDQLAQSAGARTQARSLAGKLIWRALQRGEIDVYPEYTGTISQEILAGRGLRG